MDKILLDSSVLTGHLLGNSACRQFLQKLLLSGRSPALSVMVLGSLEIEEDCEKEINSLLELFDIVPVTAPIAKKANQIEKALQNGEQHDTILSTEQTFAAATAIYEGYTLVTLPEFVSRYSANSALGELFVFSVPNS